MKYILPSDASALDALSHFYPQSSKTSLRSWIKEGRVQADGVPLKQTNTMLKQGQTISVGSKRKFIGDILPIIYEDSNIIAVDKPSGLLSVASNFETKETAHAIIKNAYHPKKIFVVHRIDQDTSGVMLFALDEKSYEKLKEMFEAHDIERAYTALVEGRMESEKGTWRSYLYEDENYVVRETDDPEEGEEAITHYKTITSNKRSSWVEFKLETGKKNQIRVHCQSAGHPILGDKKYGAKANPLKRLCLHAHLLAFKHPITQKKMRFESPIPEDFYKILHP